MTNATKRFAQIIGSLSVAAACVGFAGCNTIAGAGQDVSAGGHAVANTAEKVKNDHSDNTPAPSNSRSTAY